MGVVMFIAGAFVGAFLGVFAIAIVRSASDLHPAEELVAAIRADHAATQRELAEEREHSEALAAALANVLYMSDHGDGTGFRAGVERAVAALRAHDGAHR